VAVEVRAELGAQVVRAVEARRERERAVDRDERGGRVAERLPAQARGGEPE